MLLEGARSAMQTEQALAALERFPGLSADLPPDFVPNKEPKLDAESLEPQAWASVAQRSATVRRSAPMPPKRSGTMTPSNLSRRKAAKVWVGKAPSRSTMID